MGDMTDDFSDVNGYMDDDNWQCDCEGDVYNPNENTHCFNCGKPKPTPELVEGEVE